MIQAIADKDQALTPNSFYVMIGDELDNSYKPLILIQSQMTSVDTRFLPFSWDFTSHPKRYAKFEFNISNDGTGDAGVGKLGVGTETRPFGFYNLKIYQNISDSNTDINLVSKIIYKSMMYINTVNNDNVEYKEYSPKTNSPIYITNPL